MIRAFGRLGVVETAPARFGHNHYPTPARCAELEVHGRTARSNLDYRWASIDLNATYAPLGNAVHGCLGDPDLHRQTDVTTNGERYGGSGSSSGASRFLNPYVGQRACRPHAPSAPSASSNAHSVLVRLFGSKLAADSRSPSRVRGRRPNIQMRPQQRGLSPTADSEA